MCTNHQNVNMYREFSSMVRARFLKRALLRKQGRAKRTGYHVRDNAPSTTNSCARMAFSYGVVTLCPRQPTHRGYVRCAPADAFLDIPRNITSTQPPSMNAHSAFTQRPREPAPYRCVFHVFLWVLFCLDCP